MKLWGGRFKKPTNELVDDYNASIGFDHQLAQFDIHGSLAHVEMLGVCQILDKEDVALITKGLQQLSAKIEHGEILFRTEDEDIHMNIERNLHQLIGPTAGKLHTGRSRNDQVALDLHLYLRYQTLAIVDKLYHFMEVLLTLAADNIDTFIPGYTHLQRAEPLRFGHHILAYFHMFHRDARRLIDGFARINICPLGAGALAGSGVKVDREYVAKSLNFSGIYENSLDAVSDRDFVVEFLSAAALIMMHLSKLSEEIILWCSQEFSFIQLDDQFCTGSSMMPQKKNPDVAELARGKSGRVYGALMGLLTMLKGLPLAYNKDMQEDKEGLFDTVKTVNQTLAVYTPMIKTMRLNREKMHAAAVNDYSNATQLANYLVAKELPFRQAHEITGKIVLHCIDKQLLLESLPLEQYRQFHEKIADDIYQKIAIDQVIEAHAAKGGTAKASVLEQLEKARISVEKIKHWYDDRMAELV
ncbi:MAG: argininosuccinate lyase [Gammaproteobacteria bacterium]|nr:argininosuccinate lyase [Gammaproteobacteria bacterium]